MASNGRFEYTIGFKTDDSGLKQARKALQEIQNLTVDSPGVIGVSANLTNAKAAAAELEIALTKAFNVKMGTTSIAKLDQELKNLNRPLSEIYEDMKSIGPAGEAAFNKIAVQAMKTNLQIKQGNTILEKFGKTLWRNAEWLISGNLINTVTGVFTKAYGYTKNLDESLNNIRIVTGKGADEMERFGKEAQETAARLGKGTTDITNASLIFYQQGLDKAEVDARTEVATKLANVSQQSADTTADQLTAVWNGFQAGTDELERYADVMTAVAASTASDSAELAGSISKVASVAHTTGVDMEQLTAMMSTVISVTRDSPETVGTAFKTIFARMDDLVEDGTDEFGVSLGRVSSHLKSMGIEILNEDGTLRNLGTTLTETGDKWKSYSREQQVAIAEQMGGKRQWNQVLALFDNWDMYKNTLDTARDSTGALQEQQDIYMESTQAHLQAVKTAWEGVYGELMTADNINTVADAVSKILETIKSVIQALGGVKPILTTVAGLMMQAFSGQIAQNVVRIADNIKKADYNKMERAAQQSLTAQFGQLDSSLMKELTGYHEKILKYQKDLTPEQKKEYETLLDLRVEAENKYNILKKENDELDKLLGKYTNLNNVSNIKNDKGSWNVGILEEEIGARQAAIQQTAETGSLTGQTGRDISLGWTQEDASQTEQQIALIEGLDSVIMQLQEDTSKLGEAKKQATTEEDINNITELQSAYRAVKEELASYTEIIRTGDQEAIDSQKQVVDNAIKNLQKLETSMNGGWQAANTYAVQLGGMITGWENFSQTLADVENPFESAQLKIKNITDSLQRMGKMGVFTQEDVAALVQEYQNFGNSINESTSTEKISQGFETLKQKVLHTGEITEQELQQILKGIMEGIPQQTANVKAQIDNIKQSMQDLQSNLDFTHIAKQFTSVIGSVGQLAGALQSLSNIPKILNNEDLSTWEKFVQTLQSATIAGPMLVSSMVNMTKGSIGLVKSIKDSVLAIGLKVAAQKVENAMTQEEIKTKAIAILTEKGLSDEEIKTALAKMSNAEMSVLVAEGQLAEQAATESTTVAQLKLNAAMTANPIGLVIAAVAALIALYVFLATKLDDLKNKSEKLGTTLKYILIAVVGPAVALIGEAIKKIIELIKVKKAEDEAEKKRIQLREEMIEKNKELIKTIDENIKAFDKFSKVWDSFEKGISTIEEVKQAFQDMANQLGIAEDEEYKHLMRIAEYTDDYAPLEEYLDNIISKQKEVAAGAARQNEEQYKEQLDTALEDINSEKRIESSGYLGSNSKENDKYRKAIKLLDETGAINLTAGQSDMVYWTNNEISAEVLQNLTNNRDQIVEWTNSENENLKALGEEYLKLIDGHAGTLKLWQDAAIEAIEKEATADFTDDLGEDKTTQKVNLRKQINERLEFVAAEYEEQTGVTMTEEQKEKYHDELLADYAEMYPSKSEIVGAIEADKSLVPALTESINGGLAAAKKTMHYSLGRITEEEAQAIEDSLNKIDLKSANIDWSGVIKDTELMEHILQKKGQLTDEDLEKLKQYQKETGETINYLNQDYDSLIATYDGFNSKVEKGSFDAKTFDSKAFQEFFTDDVKEEMKEFYGEASEVGKAIDIVSDKSLIGTQKWKTAWETFGKGLDEIELKKKLNEFDEVIDNWQKKEKLKDGIEVSVAAHMDGDQYQKEVEQLLNQDYSITVDIDAKIDESVDKMHDELSKVSEMAGKIGENFSVSTDDLFDLLTTFPELAQNLTYLEDGTIQLSQTAIQAMIEEQKTNEKIQIKKKIDTIKEENEILQHKVDTYDKMIAAAELMADGEIDTQQEVTDTVDKLSAYSEDIQLANQYLGSLESEKISAEDIENWEKYYDKLDDENKKYWRGIIDRQKEVVANGTDANLDAGSYEFSEVKWDQFFSNEARYDEKDGVVYGAYRVHSTEEDKNEIINRGKELIKTYTAERDATQQILDNNKVTIAGLEAEYDAVDAKWDSLYKGMKKSTDATKDNTDATKENAEAQTELLDLLNEEIDVYHDLNIAIKQVNNELSSLQRQEEKLTSDALTKNLEEQNKLLEQQIQNYQELARRKTADLVSTRSYLESQGMNFDENGNMMNHDEMILNKMEEVNNLRSEYNSLSAEEQEGFKERVEAAEEEYEMLKKKIDLYDELQTDTIPQALADIAEAENKIIENNIKTFDLKFQIEFDKADAEKEYREFRNKVIKDLKEDDILGNTLASYEDLSYYRNIQGTGKIQILSQELSELQQARQDLAETGTSIFGDNAAAIEERIKSVTSELYKAQIEEKEAINAIENQYLDAIDTVGDKIKEQIDAYSKISDLIEHDINLIKLLYGEEAATEAVQKFQQQQEKQLWQQYDMYVKWSAQAQKEMNKVEIGSDAWKKWRSQWEEAQTGIRQSLEDIAQSIIDTYTTTIDTIYQKLDEKLGGALGLESLKSTYDFMQEQADKYLDTVNGAYAIEKLSKDMQDKINATDDVKAQQRLSELKDQEIKNLREKDKLTQYDIDRANALYDIEVKKIALKEAQQNKSKMRLRRDSQGNYSYQFVADEDSIATAAQELADAQNTLFNLDKDAYKNNLDEFYKLFTDFKEKQKQIYIDYADDAEKRQEALLQLEKIYGPAINDVIEQNANIRINHEESAFEDIGELYNLNVEDLQNMADTEKDILMNQLVPNWTNGIQDMIGQIVGEGGFLAAIQESNAELEKNVYLFKKDLGNVENAAKEQFGNDIANGNDSIVNTMESLIDSNETIIAQWATLIDELKEIVSYVVTLSKTGIRVIEAGSVTENDNQSIPIQLKNSENTTGQSTYSLDNNGYTQTTYNSIDKNKSINKTLKPKENLSPQAVQFLESAQNDPTWTKANIKQALNTINFVEAHNNQKDTSKQILDSISDKVRQNITALTRMLSFDKNSSIIGSIGNEVKTEPTSVQQNNYISADFPNAKDVYEILLAFETLENQATQMAYTTRR